MSGPESVPAPEAIRRLRQRMCWSRLTMAEELRGVADPKALARLGSAASMVRRIGAHERGEDPPRELYAELYRRLLAKYADATGEQQPPGPAAHLPSFVRPRPAGAVAAQPEPGGRLVLEDPAQIVMRARSLVASNVDAGALEEIRAAIAQIVGRYEQEGPHPLIGDMQTLRRTLHELLRGQQPPEQRRELFVLAGQAAGLNAYAAVNLGRPAVAEAYCVEAEELADHAGDIGLRMWAAGTRSLALYYQERYADADAAAAAGAALDPDSPQAIRLLVNGRARALARMRHADARRQAEQAIGRAMDLSDRFADQLPSGVSSCIDHAPYSPARTVANVITAYVSLRDTGRVLQYAGLIDELVEHSTSQWTRALVRLDVATALLHPRSRDVEQAMTLGGQALAMTTSAPIRSVWQRARELRDRVERWSLKPEAADYAAQLRRWATSPLARTVTGSRGDR
ncbi:hypothetical protein [Actinomadura violacea]|nr:hypothetical protein [Actinomadura violacea]